MECLYIPQATAAHAEIDVLEDELRHMRSLRLREGSEILVSNGSGLLLHCRVEYLNKQKGVVSALRTMAHEQKLHTRTTLVIGILDDRARMEYAIEKAVECGATDIVPLVSDHVQINKFNTARAQRKAIAALKQSRQAWLTTIHEPLPGIELLFESSFGTCIGFDADAVVSFETFRREPTEDVALVIGPEGGFSERELGLLQDSIQLFSLGKNRLRAETAAVVALGILQC